MTHCQAVPSTLEFSFSRCQPPLIAATARAAVSKRVVRSRQNEVSILSQVTVRAHCLKPTDTAALVER